MESTFTEVYEKAIWGNNHNPEYNGSSGNDGYQELENNKNTYIPFLKTCIKTNEVKSVVDLGCGDFICGTAIYDDLDVTYTGYDVYKKMVDHHSNHYPAPKYNFVHLDFSNKPQEIVSADMCIIKDVLQHWSTKTIYGFLDYLVNSKKFKYILIINCCNQMRDYTENEDEIVRNIDVTNYISRPLSCQYYPLKKYNPSIIYKFATKECSYIACGQN